MEMTTQWVEGKWVGMGKQSKSLTSKKCDILRGWKKTIFITKDESFRWMTRNGISCVVGEDYNEFQTAKFHLDIIDNK